ncbi:hypothetical protein [Calothrix rhizosoleniae]|uniref:hypothetical protein n=1 Tax=Calothrix rhizosoleniae TaxID=888997 RepID=UPI000B497106|nr:hypothetical protein [Calothrix rhizosoleniae]
MTQDTNTEVGFPDGQFMAHGLDELASMQLGMFWRRGMDDAGREFINNLPDDLREVIDRIYTNCCEGVSRVSENLHTEIAKPKISGNLVDLFPCLQPPEIRETYPKN